MNPSMSFDKNHHSGPWCHSPWIVWSVEGPPNKEGLLADETFEASEPVSMIHRLPPARFVSASSDRTLVRQEQKEALATWEDEGGVTAPIPAPSQRRQ